MKTSAKYIAIGLIGLATAFTSCTKDEIIPNTVTSTIDMRNSITQGVWEVERFNDNGVDETQNYNELLFEFRPNGEAIAIGMGITYTGTWRVSGAETNNFMFINFGNEEKLKELNSGWRVTAPVTSSILLEHAKDGKTKRLMFVRH
ncbi:MAG: hypothetical protein M3R27_07830 [Bacteroidota bacterium]|nr:hypothetical protein [Bacteroidota bacterium]